MTPNLSPSAVAAGDLLFSDHISATGQVQKGAANITGRGDLLGFTGRGGASGVDLEVRDTNGSGALIAVGCWPAGSPLIGSVMFKHPRRFANGFHATIAGSAPNRLVFIYRLEG